MLINLETGRLLINLTPLITSHLPLAKGQSPYHDLKAIRHLAPITSLTSHSSTSLIGPPASTILAYKNPLKHFSSVSPSSLIFSTVLFLYLESSSQIVFIGQLSHGLVFLVRAFFILQNAFTLHLTTLIPSPLLSPWTLSAWSIWHIVLVFFPCIVLFILNLQCWEECLLYNSYTMDIRRKSESINFPSCSKDQLEREMKNSISLN
jgi:hypothetical protein